MTKITRTGTTVTRTAVRFKDGWGIRTECSNPDYVEWGVIESCARFRTRTEAETAISGRFRADAHKFVVGTT